MSATPLTDAYLASRCKGENKQSWVEFARGLEEKLVAAFEEAARVCEANDLISGSKGPLMDMGWKCCQQACADAVRKLAPK